MSARLLVRIVGVAISVACLVYVIQRAIQVWDNAGLALAEGDTFLRLGLALVPIMVGYAAAALAWVALLRSFGVRAVLLPSVGAYLAAQVGKYLPGNVGHYVGRVVLGTRVGHPASTVTVAMTVEFALLLAMAALLSLPLLPAVVARMGAAWATQPSTGVVVVAACLAVGVIVLLAVMRWRPGWLLSLRDWVTKMRAPLGSAGAAGHLALSASLSLSAIVLASSSLLVLGESPQEFTFAVLWRVVGLYSFAWVAGVLTPGVPGGLGVREAILVEGLTPLWGASGAVAGALTFRVVTVAADAIALGLGLVALKVSGIRPAQDQPASG